MSPMKVTTQEFNFEHINKKWQASDLKFNEDTDHKMYTNTEDLNEDNFEFNEAVLPDSVQDCDEGITKKIKL